MGQRSKFLLLLRPLPGQKACKGKDVQWKLTHRPGTQQEPTAVCNNNQEAGQSKRHHQTLQHSGSTQTEIGTANRGGTAQERGSWPGPSPPPRLLLALPQSTSHNSRAATPKRTATPSHQPTADKAVNPHQGWSSSGRLAFTGFSLRDTSEKHVRHKTLTAHPLLPPPPPPPLPSSFPPGLWACCLL